MAGDALCLVFITTYPNHAINKKRRMFLGRSRTRSDQILYTAGPHSRRFDRLYFLNYYSVAVDVDG